MFLGLLNELKKFFLCGGFNNNFFLPVFGPLKEGVLLDIVYIDERLYLLVGLQCCSGDTFRYFAEGELEVHSHDEDHLVVLLLVLEVLLQLFPVVRALSRQQHVDRLLPAGCSAQDIANLGLWEAHLEQFCQQAALLFGSFRLDLVGLHEYIKNKG
jgi:hypothetical protein